MKCKRINDVTSLLIPLIHNNIRCALIQRIYVIEVNEECVNLSLGIFVIQYSKRKEILIRSASPSLCIVYCTFPAAGPMNVSINSDLSDCATYEDIFPRILRHRVWQISLAIPSGHVDRRAGTPEVAYQRNK